MSEPPALISRVHVFHDGETAYITPDVHDGSRLYDLTIATKFENKKCVVAVIARLTRRLVAESTRCQPFSQSGLMRVQRLASASARSGSPAANSVADRLHNTSASSGVSSSARPYKIEAAVYCFSTYAAFPCSISALASDMFQRASVERVRVLKSDTWGEMSEARALGRSLYHAGRGVVLLRCTRTHTLAHTLTRTAESPQATLLVETSFEKHNTITT